MTILNRANDGLFNLMLVLYEVVLKGGKQSREEVLNTCTPAGIDSGKIGQTLNRWLELGLFNEADKVISIAKPYIVDKKLSTIEIRDSLRKITRKIVFNEDNNKNFWDSEKSKSADFTRGISWLLAQDVYTLSTNNHTVIQNLEIAQLPDESKQAIQNDVRWSGLKEWAIFLGFAWEADTVVIDPTVAVRDSLDEVFGSNKVLPVEDFLKRLSNELPVIDTGKYRLEIESALNTAEWVKTEDKFLSTSLSRAFRRLEISGVLYFEKRSDTNAYKLSGRDRQEWLPNITHITYKKEIS